MKNNKNLYLCLSGLLNFYYIDEKILLYSDLLTKLDLGIPTIENFSSYEDYKEKLKISMKIDSNLIQHFQQIINSKLKIHFYKPDLLRKVEKQYFIVYNKNPLHLFLDEIILNELINEISIEHKFLFDGELVDLIKQTSAKEYMVFDLSLESLMIYHDLGCWTTLLTNYVFTYLDLENDNQGYKMISDNINYIKSGKDKVYDFTAISFYQNIYYFEHIKSINQKAGSNKANHEALEQVIKDINPVKCVLFIYFEKRSDSFQKKEKFFFSNQQVLYLTHIGGDDLSVNGQFDSILSKVIEHKDYIYYKSYFDKFKEYTDKHGVTVINGFDSFPYMIQKDIMHHYMEDFCQSETVKQLNTKYSLDIKLPYSLIVKGDDIRTHEGFMKIIKENNFKFPLVVKYQSNSHFYFKHLATIIFKEENLADYLKYFNSVYDTHLNCVLQSFVNHGGHVIKVYRIARENYIDWRSSLADINESFMSNYKEGFWTFKTKDLEGEEYRQLWRKYHGENNIEKRINEEYLFKLMDEFEKFSGLSLFGLDVLYGHEVDLYYLIDINAFPGYKIKGMDIPEKMTEHIELITRKNK
jgi:hypothetical protein